jgi:hypothetical protein
MCTLINHPIIWPLVESDWPIASIRLWLGWLLRFLPGHHLIEQQPHETKSIHLIIMFSGREAQQLRSETRIPTPVRGRSKDPTIP